MLVKYDLGKTFDLKEVSVPDLRNEGTEPDGVSKISSGSKKKKKNLILAKNKIV